MFRSTRKPSVNAQKLWKAYIYRRQTISQLAEDDGRSPRQIRRVIKNVSLSKPLVVDDYDMPVVLVMDTTYFDRFGVMVFRCWSRKKNMLWCVVDEETNYDYIVGIKHLEEQGYVIAAVVCDGKKWLCPELKTLGYAVQHCQFHMVKTITRYLTKHPKLQAGIELRRIALTLSRTNRTSFVESLKVWHEQWQTFLKEKTIDITTGRWHYTHKRIRGGYHAIMSALPYLFTWEDYPNIDIPKTTNTLEGTFSQLKQKVHVHRGLNMETKQRMITTLLRQSKLERKRKKNQPESVH